MQEWMADSQRNDTCTHICMQLITVFPVWVSNLKEQDVIPSTLAQTSTVLCHHTTCVRIAAGHAKKHKQPNSSQRGHMTPNLPNCRFKSHNLCQSLAWSSQLCVSQCVDHDTFYTGCLHWLMWRMFWAMTFGSGALFLDLMFSHFIAFDQWVNIWENKDLYLLQQVFG